MKRNEMLEAINNATEWIMEVSGDDNHEIALELSKVYETLWEDKYM